MNEIILGNCIDEINNLDDESVDAFITSPPYDNLRDYNGYSFPFEDIARVMYQKLAKGGVIVWVVGDAVLKGSETGSSFRQAIFFQELGLNIHDTMIYEKNGSSFPARRSGNRYSQVFEYMFVFSKGKPKTANLICDKKNKWSGWTTFGKGTNRDKDGRLVEGKGRKPTPNFSPRHNVWKYNTGKSYTTKDTFAFAHPAMFPESLAEDHIMTWTNPGDLIVDPFVGAGTTTKMAAINGRNWIGIDISEEYVGIARQRMEVAERMIWDGYEKDYAPEACTKKSGVLTHKEISSLKKKELVELVLKLQEKK
ncbi:MAG: putative modification methylase [Prokaryotic dsDNA virus sp.]|nr:MAG: putative modification methylase [Prokaryotic dsDNA virus sp.]|tara:strand:+ start:756 stop:1682 length:927 start_codon:yes stop_codon:yes gene_type:complete